MGLYCCEYTSWASVCGYGLCTSNSCMWCKCCMPTCIYIRCVVLTVSPIPTGTSLMYIPTAAVFSGLCVGALSAGRLPQWWLTSSPRENVVYSIVCVCVCMCVCVCVCVCVFVHSVCSVRDGVGAVHVCIYTVFLTLHCAPCVSHHTPCSICH